MVPRDAAPTRETRESIMSRLVNSIYLHSIPGELIDLDGAGTTLENPYVYDSAARELKVMADEGLVRIVHEEIAKLTDERLIKSITFARLR
jgi:hypothetical protein